LKNAQIVIGARSALFLPFYDLGFIIVDEEHEQTFKQVDPAPRYHARDASIVLANHKAKVLLGRQRQVLKPILTPNLINMVW
jgi:primosomal protein N' (replication factor Y)